MLRSPLKDDIAWLLYVARRWMSGRELYVDVVEINPPLIVWISAIPIWLAGALGIDAQFTAIPFFVAAVLACAWWTASLLRGSGKLFEDRLPVFAAIGTVLLVVPAGDLGQREHLLVAAILPYLALFARSLDGERTVPRDALIAGGARGSRLRAEAALCRGLRCARGSRGPARDEPVPHHAARRRDDDAGLRRPGRIVLPRLSAPCRAAGAGAVWRDRRASAASGGGQPAPDDRSGGGAAAVVARRHRAPEGNLMLTLVVFAITSTAICFMDGKDWFYHRLPATIATVLALLCWAASALSSPAATRRAYLPVAAGAVAVVVFLVAAFQRLEPQVALAVEPEQGTVVKLERLIRQAACAHLHRLLRMDRLGFPVVNNTGVAWASRFDSMWALKGNSARPFRCCRGEGVADPPLGRARLHRRLPDIAVVDTRDGVVNYVGVLSASDPAFARAWSRYRQIASFDGLEVYRRAATGCIDPWVAAEAPQAIDSR